MNITTFKFCHIIFTDSLSLLKQQSSLEISMNPQLQNLILYQNYMAIKGPQLTCDVIHKQTSCVYQILHKMGLVMKSSFQMYIVLHSILFLLKLKKFKRDNRIREGLKRTVKNIIGSLFFMSWLTGGMKASLCALNSMECFLDWRAAVLLAFVGSTSCYFEQPSRRGEISYFVFVRSLRSLYILLKKRWNFPISSQKQISFILIFGLISYLYHQGPTSLKHRNYLQKLWGQA